MQAGGGKWLSGEGRYWNSGLWRSTSTTSTAISLDSGALKFYTNSGLTANSGFSPSERMRINSDGNVGIGTSTVGNKLTVVTSTQYDGYYLRNSSGVVGTMLGSSAANDDGTIGLYSSVVLKTIITANGASYFNGGSVGIGTSSPNDLLQLQASSSTAYDATSDNGQYGSGAGITITNMDETSQSFAQVNLQVSGNAGRALGRIVAIRTASATSDLAFVTENANTKAEKMRILSDGNVGIGTTSPASKLYVVSSGGPIARFDGSSVASSGATEIDVLGPQSNGDLNLGVGGSTFNEAANNIQNKGYITTGTGLTGLNLRSDAGYVQITTGGIASANERMRIAGDGNVGIGTTSPTARLHVSGSTRGVFEVDTAGGTTTLYVSASGNIGIGTTNPGALLLSLIHI